MEKIASNAKTNKTFIPVKTGGPIIASLREILIRATRKICVYEVSGEWSVRLGESAYGTIMSCEAEKRRSQKSEVRSQNLRNPAKSADKILCNTIL